MKKYSAMTGGFYAAEVHGGQIPEDAVDVTETDYAALFIGQANGKVIVPGPDGSPILADPPQPSVAELWRNLRDQRNRLLADTDFGKDTPDSVTAKFAAYRKALRDLPANTEDPMNPIWPVKPA